MCGLPHDPLGSISMIYQGKEMLMMSETSTVSCVSRKDRREAPRYFRVVILFLISLSISGRSAAVELLEVAANTPHLELSVHWGEDPPPMVRLVLLDVAGQEVVSGWYAPIPGETTVEVLDGGLLDLIARGPQHQIQAEDETGHPLAVPLPFRISVECPEGTCTFRTHNGVWTSESLLWSEELATALREAEETGAEELLSAVLWTHPELTGQIHTLAWQLQDLDQRFPSGETCRCRWATLLERQGPTTEASCGMEEELALQLWQDSPDEDTTCAGPGDGSPSSLEISEDQEVEVGVGCWAPKSLGTEDLQVDGVVYSGWPRLALQSCGSPCTGEVEFQARHSNRLSATSNAAATVSETVAFSLNGLAVFEGSWQADSAAHPESEGAMEGSVGGTTGDRAHLAIHSQLDWGPGTGGFEGEISSESDFTGDGLSLCASPRRMQVQIDPRVGDPILGVDINIVVGQCDG